MTDLATLKEDLDTMKFCKRWIEAIGNVTERDLSAEWKDCFKTFIIERTNRLLDRMIGQCESYIEIAEGLYEKNEE